MVVEGIDDGDVAVHADTAQVEERGRAEQHVVGVEDVTQRAGEQPLTYTNKQAGIL